MIDIKMMAIQVAMILPTKNPLRIRQRVFNEKSYGADRLSGEEGFSRLGGYVGLSEHEHSMLKQAAEKKGQILKHSRL